MREGIVQALGCQSDMNVFFFQPLKVASESYADDVRMVWSRTFESIVDSIDFELNRCKIVKSTEVSV